MPDPYPQPLGPITAQIRLPIPLSLHGLSIHPPPRRGDRCHHRYRRDGQWSLGALGRKYHGPRLSTQPSPENGT
jgi:hypothetical protein